jgi:hypothetical protein
MKRLAAEIRTLPRRRDGVSPQRLPSPSEGVDYEPSQFALAEQLDPFARSLQSDLLTVKSRLENRQAGVNVVELRHAPSQLLFEVRDFAGERGALVSERMQGVFVAMFAHCPFP